jgi:hypothetical protein
MVWVSGCDWGIPAVWPVSLGGSLSGIWNGLGGGDLGSSLGQVPDRVTLSSVVTENNA